MQRDEAMAAGNRSHSSSNKVSVAQLLQLGLQHHRAGRLAQAEEQYRQILQADSNQADALYLLGSLAYGAGNHEMALELNQRAIRVQPDNPVFHDSLGATYQALKRLDEAVASYRQALALKPDQADAHFNLGTALQAQGKQDAAIDSYQKALALNPSHAVAHNNLGNVYKAQGKLDEAADCYRKAIALNPDFFGAHNNLGNVYKEQGRLEDAWACYQKSLAINPAFAETHSNLGVVLHAQGKLDDAIECFRQSLALDPAYAEAHNNLGAVLLDQGNLNAAVECCNQAISLKPDFAEAYNNLGTALKDLGRLDAAIECCRKALALKPDEPQEHSNLLLSMQYSPQYTPEETFAEHLHFAQKFEAPLKPHWPVHQNLFEPEKRLKVGYVSGDFRNHVVTRFIKPILANHDKSQFEIFCYHNHAQHDSVTGQIAALADHWISCAGWPDGQLAERIRDDGIDILVDLSGHTGFNRLLTFARKPAPVQVTWIGFPGTTGLAAMDYRLTDGNMDPPGMTEKYHTETLVRLPSSAAFQPADDSPPVNELPALASGHFTLGSLNNLVKINDEVARFWARIMLALPHARLMLGNVMDELTRQRLIDLFAQEGVAAGRLVLHPTMSLSNYLALHHQIDLALDPFPYNGGTSTYHSLWMGVPVITLAGNYSAARVGVAIMQGTGLTEFITASQDEYFKLVLVLANDLQKLNRMRQSLRQRIASRSVAGHAQMTRSLESAYRDMWKRKCDDMVAS